jgi:hypothetical protein
VNVVRGVDVADDVFGCPAIIESGRNAANVFGQPHDVTKQLLVAIIRIITPPEFKLLGEFEESLGVGALMSALVWICSR